jgi:hypothetical protein
MSIRASIFTILTNTEQLRYSKFYRIWAIKVKIMVTNIFIYLRIMSDCNQFSQNSYVISVYVCPTHLTSIVSRI